MCVGLYGCGICGVCMAVWVCVSVVWFVRLWSLVDWFVGRGRVWWTVSLVDWFVVAGLARRCVETGRWSRRIQCRCCVWLVHKF